MEATKWDMMSQILRCMESGSVTVSGNQFPEVSSGEEFVGIATAPIKVLFSAIHRIQSRLTPIRESLEKGEYEVGSSMHEGQSFDSYMLELELRMVSVGSPFAQLVFYRTFEAYRGIPGSFDVRKDWKVVFIPGAMEPLFKEADEHMFVGVR